MSKWLLLLCFSANLVLAAPGAHGPNGEHISDERRNASGEQGRQADGSVILPMADQALLGIRTQFVTPTKIGKRVKLPAVVRPHPEGHALIQPSSDGRFEAPDSGVFASGVSVSAGQILGYVRYQDTAFELASQTSELFAVRNDITQTQRDVKRLRDLGELASKQALEQLETQLKSLTEQEKALEQGLEKPEPLIAPISGVLVNHQARNGKWVEAGTTLFEIVAPNLRQLDAVSGDASLVSKLTTASLAEFSGTTLSYQGYSPRLSGGMTTLHFEYRSTEETPSVMLLDQPVTLLATMAEQIEGMILPANAVVKNSANLPIVWIKVTAERFLPQVVGYQNIEPGIVVVTSGLGADNRVVVNGTSLLNQVR